MPETVRHLGLIGSPISHSLSPLIHGHWFAQLGIDAGYRLLDGYGADFEATIRQLRQDGIDGFNVTVPWKECMLGPDVLHGLDFVASQIGAVNTVVSQDGRWTGYNTDAPGFVDHLVANLERPLEGRMVVVGAGGAARAIVSGLCGGEFQWNESARPPKTPGRPAPVVRKIAADGRKIGLLDPTEIVLLNRTRARAEQVRQAFDGKSGAHGPRFRVVDWEERDAVLDEARLLVNTTSLGMHGQPPLEISLDAMPEDGVVADIVYVPLETPLLADAQARGLIAVDGLGMLIGQAARAFELWFGVRPDTEDHGLRAKLLAALAARAAAS